MKHIILALSLFTLASTSFGQSRYLEAPFNEEYSTSLPFYNNTLTYITRGTADSVLTTEKFYNSDGQFTNGKYFNSNTGELNYTWTWEYNEENRLKSISNDYNLDGIPDNVTDYEYNSEGVNFKKIGYYGDRDSINYTSYLFYDDRGRYVRSFSLNTKGDTTYTFNRAYNSDGKYFYTAYDTDGDGNTNFQSSYAYSDTVNIEYYVRYDNPSRTYTKYSYLDENGYVIRTEQDNGPNDTIDIVERITNNSLGRPIMYETLSATTGEFYKRQTSEYNLHGSTVSNTYYTEAGDSTKYTYVYENTLKCDILSQAKAHKIRVNIPEDGEWKFSTCGSSFNTILALSSETYCDSSLMYDQGSCADGKAEFTAKLKKGRYYLTVSGVSELDEGVYNLDVSFLMPLSTADIHKGETKIYPQPATNQIHIVSDIQISIIEILDIQGKHIAQMPFSKTMDVSHLNQGTYILRLKNNQELVGNKKLIITN